MAKSRASRNYRQEYDRYQGQPEQIANRSERNQARAQLMKEGRVSKGDGKDVNHIKPLIKGGSNSKGNLNVQSKHANRSYARTKNAGYK